MAGRIPAERFTANDELALRNKIIDAYSFFEEEVNGILTGEPISDEFDDKVKLLLKETGSAIDTFRGAEKDDDDEDETEDGNTYDGNTSS
jgi:hypothetical protein